jgi:hypothetical protein
MPRHWKTFAVLAIAFLALLIVNPAYAQVLPPNSSAVHVDTPSRQFLQSLPSDQIGMLLSEDIGESSTSFIASKTVVWYNDLGLNVTMSSKFFNNVTILKDQSFSYTFDTPGIYWVHVNDTLSKQRIQVYDVLNDCTIDQACGNPSGHSICQEFGQVNSNGKCVSGPELEKVVKAEFERRNNVIIERQSQADQKTLQKQELQNQEQSLIQQESNLDREALGEDQYMKQYNDLQSEIGPVEQQMNQLEKEISDLQQSNIIENVCVKDPVTFFICTTEINKNSALANNIPSTAYPNPILSSPPINLTQYQQSNNTPAWTKKVFQWYDQGQISEQELFSFVKWLIDNKIMGS